MSTDGTPLPPLHDLEAEVMEEVWSREEVSVRQLLEALNGRSPQPRAYTTYLTVVQRLDKKGLVLRRRDGKTDFYRAAYSREQYSDSRAGAEVDSLVEQFGDAALSHFARQVAELDPERRRALERLARKR